MKIKFKLLNQFYKIWICNERR